jgi:Xaa-Pro aminopeptidase
MAVLIDDEAARVAGLLEAQRNAAALFDLVEAQGIIAAGVAETEASNAIRDLAAEHFGVERHWHKRIVRSGPNTLEPYRMNPPDRVIEADDIAFCDFGPIFAEWEADFGRTYVLGDDPIKQRLREDLPVLFEAGRAYFVAEPDITGDALFNHVVGLAEQAGWEWGGTIAGHLVGQFPHDEIEGDDVHSHVMPGSTRPMRGLDSGGRICHWILEIHVVDRARQIGGFYEELLDLGHGSS